MNVDGSESVLNSHICFNALATLQNIKNVENSCNFCSSYDHSTYMCPVLSKGEHVKDTSTDNLSWSSVPHGLQVYQDETGSHIISVQKFAKGCRFGPLMAPKSHLPIEHLKFPLIIFGNVNFEMDSMYTPEISDLFKVRQYYLDTRDEKYCNWMVHVDPAQYSNEQNLIAYEEDNEIFFAAIEDLDMGDILKVWYSPKYGNCMKMLPLQESAFPIMKNVMNRGGVLPETQMINPFSTYEPEPSRTEIMLPSIKTIIKPSSYVSYENLSYNSVSPYYSAASPPFVSPMVEQPSSFDVPPNYTSILNLDDTYSGETELNDLMGYDQDSEKMDKNTANDATDMAAYPTSTVQNVQEKDEKKSYPCRLCDKKYSTMTNIYRHVRAQHSCFLCSLCMKIFNLEADLKEHKSKCPKSDFKKPQCHVCMQYFSNSWSLTRHIKIHVAAGECDPDILIEKKVKDIKKPKDDSKENYDLSDIEKNSQDGFLIGNMMPDTPSYEPDLSNLAIASSMPLVKEINGNLQTVALDKLEITSSDLSDKDGEICACVVCEKKFKSKSCMNKHLRNVHAVKILSAGVKRSATNPTQSKSATNKRSYLNESQSSITHTGSPVNPLTAKALASKLNERNSMLNGAKKASTAGSSNGSANDIPVPPLVSIQTASANNRFKDDNDKHRVSSMRPTKVSQSAKHYVTDGHCKPSNERKHHKNDTSRHLNGNNSTHHKKVTGNQVSTLKTHKCDFCAKKFSKKYELSRHRAVHENITFACPYCDKKVKRKPSMLKHLRLNHKDEEHIWNDNSFIAQLKRYTKPALEGYMQSESSNTNESKAASDIDSVDNGESEEIYKNVFLGGDTKSTMMSGSHGMQATSDDEMSLLEASSTVDLVGHRKQSMVNIAAQSSLNNIIDDCFFGEDALNCNVVLVHSPFSSDNDVDGFNMDNDNGDCVMNKELLNKFHDRLEEMEEKVDSTDFKAIWDHVLDEDNLNDDICTDDIDDSVVV